MAEPIANTDAGYENDRRQAEQEFYLAAADWLGRVVQEAEKLKSGEVSIKKIQIEVADVLLPGDQRLRTEPQWPGADLLIELLELCSEYGEAELRAYAELLHGRGVPRSQAVKELDEHEKETLREIHEHKWTPRIRQLTGVFDLEPWIEQEWRDVEERIREFVRSELHPWIWFEGAEGEPEDGETTESRQGELQERAAGVGSEAQTASPAIEGGVTVPIVGDEEDAISAQRLPTTVTSPIAARRMVAYIESKVMTQTEFASKVGTTDRTLRAFRRTGKVRRDIFDAIARAMGTTREELARPE
jgi:hypothetical protein